MLALIALVKVPQERTSNRWRGHSAIPWPLLVGYWRVTTPG